MAGEPREGSKGAICPGLQNTQNPQISICDRVCENRSYLHKIHLYIISISFSVWVIQYL